MSVAQFAVNSARHLPGVSADKAVLPTRVKLRVAILPVREVKARRETIFARNKLCSDGTVESALT